MILCKCPKCDEPISREFPHLKDLPEYKAQEVFVRQLVAITEAKENSNYARLMDLVEEAATMLELHDNGEKGEFAKTYLTA